MTPASSPMKPKSGTAHATASAVPAASQFPVRRMIRRSELRRFVPLADTTIYELEQRGEFPGRFNLTARCVVWDLAEVEAWMKGADAHRKPRGSSAHRHPTCACAGRVLY